MLTPKTGHGAGILHKNSMALAQLGPWNFSSVTWGDAVDGPSDGQAVGPQHRVRGGTCDICSASIINIVTLISVNGQRVTVGVDCAETLLSNQAKLKLKAAIAPHEKAKREAAKARKLARTIEANVTKYAAELAMLDKISEMPAYKFLRSPSWGRAFASDTAWKLRNGKISSLSEKQLTLINKLASA